jgi:hypothetical protein
VNAFVRLSSALVLPAALALGGCATTQRDAWSSPREYREIHLAGDSPMRSTEQSLTVLHSHERSHAAHERASVILGK